MMPNKPTTLREWRRIEHHEDYEVSNLGEVRSTKANRVRLLKPDINHRGYPRFQLSTKGKLTHKLAHRLVAEAFIPNPKKLPQVNHKNGLKTDNQITNLEWVTNEENRTHAIDNGLLAFGSRVGSSRLNEKKAIEILSRINQGETQQSLAIEFNLAIQTINDLYKNRTWKHIPRPRKALDEVISLINQEK